MGQDDRPRPTRQCEVRHHRQGPLGERDGEVGTTAVHDQQGDQGHLQRDRQQRDRADEQRLAALEVDPGEGVGRERGDRIGMIVEGTAMASEEITELSMPLA